MTIYHATAITPIHHGDGTSGNTSLLRTEEVILPDGRQARVPFISGNSIRHTIREALAWHTAKTLEFEEQSLPKPVIDLLWTGGAVTTSGANIDLELSRKVEKYYPPLALLGYAALSDIVTGQLEVTHLQLVCKENAWRYPDSHPFTEISQANFRGEEFGTRHDIQGSAVDRFLEYATATPTTQMIYELQTIKPGAVLWGEIRLKHGASPVMEKMLSAALTLTAPEGYLGVGAKNAVGFGQIKIDGWKADHEAVEWFTNHLRENKDDIATLLKELGK